MPEVVYLKEYRRKNNPKIMEIYIKDKGIKLTNYEYVPDDIAEAIHCLIKDLERIRCIPQ